MTSFRKMKRTQKHLTEPKMRTVMQKNEETGKIKRVKKAKNITIFHKPEKKQLFERLNTVVNIPIVEEIVKES